MTDRDKQFDDVLEQTLASLDIPAASGDARRRAIAMARAEFEKVHAEGEQKNRDFFQAFLSWLRPIVSNDQDNRSAIMMFNQKIVYSGITAIAIGAVAVGITLQNSSSPDFTGGGLAGEVVQDSEAGFMAADSLSIAADQAAGQTLLQARDQIVTRKKQTSQATVDTALEAEGLALADGLARDLPSSETAFSSVVAKKQEFARPMPQREALPSPHFQAEGRDSFKEFEQNRVKAVSEQSVSTFSADVDTASYSFVRRMLNSGVLPAIDAVRAEELINYFDYDYPVPDSRQKPFQATVAVSDSPWADGRKLLHIGIKGYDIAPANTPRSNVVFLLDVSGSMNSPDKLPLVKQSMSLLLSTLHPEDTVAIVVYAGAAGVVLEPTSVKEKQKILNAMAQLSAGGSTAGAQGIRLAYELAQSGFKKEAVNRVILATDGDFNVGISNQRELQGFIERKRNEGIFLSVLGFGQGNYQDALMQSLAQNGNGVAAYIDTLSEAQKVLVTEATSTLFPIARDVKFQVEFNPATVAEYRLVGYETRHLNREDFNNDAVDAGDIGAGHTVTAIYEFTPVGSTARRIDEQRYAQQAASAGDESSEYAFLKIRYKLPGEDSSELLTQAITRSDSVELGTAGTGYEAGFATAVAGFAQLLKGGKYTGDYGYDDVIELALKTRGDDPFGYRTEFVQLVRKAETAAAMVYH